MNILITGATGFLGEKLIEYYSKINDIYYPIALGRKESKLAEFKKKYNCHIFCCDILDKRNLEKCFDLYSPSLVIHAAALKRVDICQDNPEYCISTNIIGTQNVLDCCTKYKADIVYISTDKAFMPQTTYGASKYMGEQIVGRSLKNVKSVVVRYGNVLNSTGSVLEMWENQYKQNGKVIVRSKKMTRFFWTVEESIQFIDKTVRKIDEMPSNWVIYPRMCSMNIYEMAVYLYGEKNIKMGKPEKTEKTHEYIAEDICSKDFVVDPSKLLNYYKKELKK